MAILRYNDIAKMSDSDRKTKLKDLKIELVKSQVTANKTNAKNREIKRAISRLLTYNQISKSAKGGAELKK